MSRFSYRWLGQIVRWLALLLLIKVTLFIVLGYRNYFPPNFGADFLRHRENDFFGWYQWAFYAHILTGPITLILGTLLVSETMRNRWPRWHRNLGRVQILIVLLFVVPSGLWMAWYAAAGPVAGLGLAMLAVLTGFAAGMGWQTATRRKFADHHRWMWRCYLLLCSAVVLRVLSGFSIATGLYAEWTDPVNTWASWMIPLFTFEVVQRSSTVKRALMHFR